MFVSLLNWLSVINSVSKKTWARVWVMRSIWASSGMSSSIVDMLFFILLKLFWPLNGYLYSGFSVHYNDFQMIFSPRFMKECFCLEQGALRKNQIRKWLNNGINDNLISTNPGVWRSAINDLWYRMTPDKWKDKSKLYFYRIGWCQE